MLPSGKVLVATGYPATTTAAELYDPATNAWSAAGNLLQGRYQAVGTLDGNGRAIVAGGNTNSNAKLSSTEAYAE